MGLTHIRVEVVNPSNVSLTEEIELLADTGSVYPSIPRKVLERLGVRPERMKPFTTIEGRKIERSTGTVFIRYGGSEASCEVVFAEDTDPPVLGVVALEGLGYTVNPISGKIEYVGFLAV